MIVAVGPIRARRPTVTRRIPFIITGVQTVADVEAAFERGAAAKRGLAVG